jgi:MFS family permease
MIKMKDDKYLRVLKNKNFLKLWGSQILSQVALNMLNFVLVLKIFEKTESTIAVSLVLIFYALPAIILGPFSGTLVDLWNKRRLLMMTNAFQGIIILFYIPIKDLIWPIYSIIFLYSFVNQFYIPGEAATLPGVVKKENLPAANSIFLFSVYGAFMGGYGLAGPVVKIAGWETPFAIASLMLWLACISVSLLPKEQKRAQISAENFTDFWIYLKEGYQFIRDEPLVFLPSLLLVFSQILSSSAAILFPSYASKILAIDIRDLSVALIVPAGLGAFAGAAAVVRCLKTIRKKSLIELGVFLASFCLFLLSFLIPKILDFHLRLAVSGAIMFLIGIAFVFFAIPTQTLIQEHTPKKLRGRVFGFLGFMITLGMTIPVLVAATIADILGVTWIIFSAAVLIGIVGIYSRWGFPSWILRR